MILTTEQIKQIVAAGGGLSIDAASMTFVQLKEIVAAATTKKASLTLKNIAGLTAAQLSELAALAPGLVTFDLAAESSPLR